VRDPDEGFDRGADDPGTKDRGTRDRYGARVAQAPAKKKQPKKKPPPPKPEEQGEQGEAESPIVEVTPEDRSKQPPPNVKHDMDLGKKLPDPPSITDRDLKRARVVNYPIVRVEVIDLSGVVSRHWKKVKASIEKRLDGVTDKAGDLDVTQHVTIASYQSSEPSAKVKSGQLPLDFPCYFLPRERKRPSDDRDGSKMMRRILSEHLAKKKAIDIAISRWEATTLRGVTCPAIGSARSIVFMNSDQMVEEAASDAVFFANEILHELGHALGLHYGKSSHPNDGSLMQPAKQPGISLAYYNDRHARAIAQRINAFWQLELKQLSRP